MNNIMTADNFNEKNLIGNNDYLYLVFNRSFKWPYCKKKMLQLQEEVKKFDEKKIKLVVICPEKVEDVEKFAEKHNISFDLVSDPKHIIADKYGQQIKILKLGRMPAEILLDKDCKIITKHYGNNMADTGSIIDSYLK